VLVATLECEDFNALACFELLGPVMLNEPLVTEEDEINVGIEQVLLTLAVISITPIGGSPLGIISSTNR